MFNCLEKLLETEQNESFWSKIFKNWQKTFWFDPEFWFKNVYIRSVLERKQQNVSFRSWKNVGLTLLIGSRRFHLFSVRTYPMSKYEDGIFSVR